MGGHDVLIISAVQHDDIKASIHAAQLESNGARVLKRPQGKWALWPHNRHAPINDSAECSTTLKWRSVIVLYNLQTCMFRRPTPRHTQCIPIYIARTCSHQHCGKTSAHASTLLKSVLRTWCQVFRMLSKTQNGSDFDILPFLRWKCKQNNERDNLKTRNNSVLSTCARSSIMQENKPKVTVDKFIV
jgi:hypothetical protein